MPEIVIVIAVNVTVPGACYRAKQPVTLPGME